MLKWVSYFLDSVSDSEISNTKQIRENLKSKKHSVTKMPPQDGVRFIKSLTIVLIVQRVSFLCLFWLQDG